MLKRKVFTSTSKQSLKEVSGSGKMKGHPLLSHLALLTDRELKKKHCIPSSVILDGKRHSEENSQGEHECTRRQLADPKHPNLLQTNPMSIYLRILHFQVQDRSREPAITVQQQLKPAEPFLACQLCALIHSQSSAALWNSVPWSITILKYQKMEAQRSYTAYPT